MKKALVVMLLLALLLGEAVPVSSRLASQTVSMGPFCTAGGAR
jgi:hypothetical protein